MTTPVLVPNLAKCAAAAVLCGHADVDAGEHPCRNCHGRAWAVLEVAAPLIARAEVVRLAAEWERLPCSTGVGGWLGDRAAQLAEQAAT